MRLSVRRVFSGVLVASLLGVSCSPASTNTVPATGSTINTATSDTATSDTATSDTSTSGLATMPVVDLPDVVVTHSILGAVVSALVSGVADVVVLIPDGQDPHTFEPSAKDIEMLNSATLVVANGLGLEAGIESALANAADNGTNVFYVADNVTLIDVVDVNDHSDHGHNHPGGDAGHVDDHVHSQDPHVWLSPRTMREALPALADAIGDTLQVDMTIAEVALDAQLRSLDAELTALFSKIDTCQLVTGHNELGYFALHYGCAVVAAVISSPSTSAEESAGNLEFVIDVITTHGAKVIFVSLGANLAVAEQVANDAGARIVELSTHYLGESVDYIDFMRRLGTTIAENLT